MSGHPSNSAEASDTIAALITAPLPAGIATIGIRGPTAVSIVRSCVQINTSQLQTGRIYYGRWLLDSSQPTAEQVVVCRTGPAEVEIHCHGGPAISRRVLLGLIHAGCRSVSASQWSTEACPIRRAAESDLLASTTDRAAAVLLDQLNGSLSVALDRLVAALRSNLLPQADSMLTELLKWADFGLHLSRPWRIVLAGPPNVGKSSLTNAILGSQRAIVHEQPGTTRDWTETLTAIDGWPVSITDTAGIRLAKDEIERQGIELATAQLQRADLVVIMVDAQVGWTEVHARLLQQAPRRRIIAWNKCDLMEANYDSLPSDLKLVPSVRLSCVNGIGIESLIRLIAEGLVPEIPQPGVAIAFRESQVRQLRLALRAVHDQSPEVALSGIQSLRCGPTQYGDDQH